VKKKRRKSKKQIALLKRQIARVTLGVFIASCTCGIFATNGPFSFWNTDLRPYAGVGVQHMRLKLPSEYGKPLFQQANLGGNVFVGTRMGKHFGVELGYGYTFSKKTTRRIVGTDTFPPGNDNDDLNMFDWLSVQTKLQSHAMDLSITSYMPILNSMELFGTMGLSRTTIKVQYKVIDDSDPDIDAEIIQAKMKKTKIIPFYRIGLQAELVPQVYLGLFGEWKNVKRLVLSDPNNSKTKVKFKNTLTYGMKIFYNF
jgi:hypothetical protein